LAYEGLVLLSADQTTLYYAISANYVSYKFIFLSLDATTGAEIGAR